MKQNDYIQSVERSMSILNFIADTGSVRLKDICNYTGLNKSTAFGLIRTLEHGGYVSRINNGLDYCLGLNCLKLGICYNLETKSKEKIHHLLERLVEETGETAYFEIKAQSKFYYYDMVASKFALKVVPDNDKFVSLPDNSAVAKVYRNYRDKIKYETDLEEIEKGLNCFATPFMAGDEILGCIAITGPSNRFTSTDIEKTYEIYCKIMNELDLLEHVL